MPDNSFECKYCNKIFKAKQGMERHFNVCKIYMKEQEDKEKEETQQIISENIKLKEEIKNLLEENDKLKEKIDCSEKEEIKKLRDENDKLKEEIKCSKYEFEIKMSKLETEIYKYQYKYQTENMLDIIDIIKQINNNQ